MKTCLLAYAKTKGQISNCELINLFPKSAILSLLSSSVAVKPGLCQTGESEIPITDFLVTQLIFI